MSSTLHIPASLLQDLRPLPGFDEQAFVAAHAQPAPVSVRLHPVKGGGIYTDLPAIPWCDGGRYLPERPIFTLDPAYHAGAYYVQEASSIFLHHVLRGIIGQRKGLRVLDLCAAPGGKSTLIASLLDADGLLVSNEVIRTRASILEENMLRWGYMNTWVTSNDPRDLGRLTGYFDIIVVDAPCSGSGLWRKDAAALNEWSEANVQLCAARQQRILADVWPALKTGGTLVYATCSYSPQEDEDILDHLATELHAGTLPIPIDASWGIEEVVSPLQKQTGYRFFPHRVRGEGFFIAAMTKNDDAGSLKTADKKHTPDKKIQQMAGHYFGNSDVLLLPGKDGSYNAIRPQHHTDLQLLQKAVFLRRTGIEAGMPSAKEWLPAHDIALSVDTTKDIPHIDVSKEQALHFLKREEMGMADVPKGWYIVRYNGLGLGWVKALGNRMNNYLPKHWRIRMNIDEI
ncbi:rRNA cytosine-C5-methyltransferase [Nemorincola caseinilytica]|uniref:rRNA cytosine-C5-methyltransferase n=1 Tax=Nemorincola caseinilytica TaxID=2054315 RepID=A0ABP8N715_9BACT